MKSKHGSNGGNATGGKKQGNSITHDKRLDVMKKYACNTSTADNTTNSMGIPASTLRTSRK
jgi:hypothetical protein